MKLFSKIMWGTILGLLAFSFVIILAGGNGNIISYYAGYMVPYAFIIQIIIWIILKKEKKKMDTSD